jgi:hypothetical protein
VAQEGGNPIVHAGGTKHMGIAETDKARALGMFREAGFQADLTQRVWLAAGGAHGAEIRQWVERGGPS